MTLGKDREIPPRPASDLEDRISRLYVHRIEQLIAPGGPGVRFDSHAYAGYSVPPHYDSLIGKLIVHQPTREEAMACMARALSELRVKGIETTVAFHQRMLKDSSFVEGCVDTTYVDRTYMSRSG